MIEPGKGVRLDAFRAFVNNDNWIAGEWYANGLHNLRPTVTAADAGINEAGNAVLNFKVRYQAPNAAKLVTGHSAGKQIIKELADTPATFAFDVNETYTVYPDGSVELEAQIDSNNPDLVLPRLGFMLNVPENLSNYTYYGRGPVENYNDRCEQNLGVYSSTVARQFVNYAKPQNMANREEVRWASLTTPDGSAGLVAVGASPLSVNALPYDESALVAAPHPFELPAPGATRLHLSIGQTGLGGTSCGQAPPSENHRVMASTHRTGFVLRPVDSVRKAETQAMVKF